MRPARDKKTRSSRRSEPVILFTVGATRFAIAANAVDEIRNMDGLQPAPPARHPKLAKIKHLLEREHKMYFVVDANLHYHMFPSKHARVLVLRDSVVAVLVDNIERMAEITLLHPLPHAFTGEERGWYRGLVVLDEQVVPVVSPASFLSKAEHSLMSAALTEKPVQRGATA
jgi:chemotaxis signal transduction protein